MRVRCSFCDILFDWDGKCPYCGKDREGYTESDRMKKRRNTEISGTRRIRERRKSKKINRNPFEGESTNIRWRSLGR